MTTRWIWIALCEYVRILTHTSSNRFSLLFIVHLHQFYSPFLSPFLVLFADNKVKWKISSLHIYWNFFDESNWWWAMSKTDTSNNQWKRQCAKKGKKQQLSEKRHASLYSLVNNTLRSTYFFMVIRNKIWNEMFYSLFCFCAPKGNVFKSFAVYECMHVWESFLWASTHKRVYCVSAYSVFPHINCLPWSSEDCRTS